MWCCLTRRQDRLVLPWLHGLLSDYPECVRSTYCVMIDWFRDCVVEKYKVVAGNRGYTYTKYRLVLSGFLLNTILGLHGVHFLFCQREKKVSFECSGPFLLTWILFRWVIFSWYFLTMLATPKQQQLEMDGTYTTPCLQKWGWLQLITKTSIS